MGKPIYIRLGRVRPPIGFKMCACCEGIKPIEEFRNASKTSDKHQAYCNDCSDTYKRGYIAGKRFANKPLNPNKG